MNEDGFPESTTSDMERLLEDFYGGSIASINTHMGQSEVEIDVERIDGGQAQSSSDLTSHRFRDYGRRL